MKFAHGNPDLIVVGGGLAGSEAAWQAAIRGLKVRLYEMRPIVQTGAHQGDKLAELVCSNSLGSDLPDRASGVLKSELRVLGSLLIRCADETSLPAGGALAVDRESFAQRVTAHIDNHPNIEIVRQEITDIPNGPTIIASGPLTSKKLSAAIQRMTGYEQIFFYDALAPIIQRSSIDMDIAYQGARYGKNSAERVRRAPLHSVQTEGSEREQGVGDYINCPMSKDEYYHFVDELIGAERIKLLDFEKSINNGVRAGTDTYFEACLPVEVIAMRGKDALAYGPMRPVGLSDPRTDKHAFAVVQLRQDNLAKTLYNLVGFQTNLTYSEQERVLRLIPGLGNVEFARYGQMHRNTFIFSPALLRPTLQYCRREELIFAGQIIGVEGYVGNIATGYLAGMNAVQLIHGKPLLVMPQTTIIGALVYYITHAAARDFQPMKANFGILPELAVKLKDKRDRAVAYAERSKSTMLQFLAEHPELNIIEYCA